MGGSTGTALGGFSMRGVVVLLDLSLLKIGGMGDGIVESMAVVSSDDSGGAWFVVHSSFDGGIGRLTGRLVERVVAVSAAGWTGTGSLG